MLDQLLAAEAILLREATGCTDNPICFEDELLHGGNFHAMPVGLISDQLGLCLQQVAYLAERQLVLLCDPGYNGGAPLMLTPRPGAGGSGLAGVQLSATSFVSKIRQLVYPASLTALPTTTENQDHVPMALNGATAVTDAIELAWLVVGSVAVGLAQYAALDGRTGETGLWAKLAEVPHRWTGTVHSPRRSALPAISWPPRRTSWSTTADGSVGGPDPTDTSQWIGRTRRVRVLVTMTVSHSHVTNGAIGHE